MTNGQAVDRLFAGWLWFAVVSLVLVTVQAFADKYDVDWAVPAHWIIALVAPSLALLWPAKSNKGKSKWKDKPVDAGNYKVAFWMSLAVWLGASGIFAAEVVSDKYRIYDLLPAAGLALMFLQAFVIRAVASIAFSGR